SGEDEFQSVMASYIRGASGYILVVDGTRRETLDTAIGLRHVARGVLGSAACIPVLHKADLAALWGSRPAPEKEPVPVSWPVVRTSAKTGEGIEQAFGALVRAMVSAPRRDARL